MRAIEFKSKIRNNRIQIPKELQPELSSTGESNVRIMIFLEDPLDSDFSDLNTVKESYLTKEEIQSIEAGLVDIEEGRTHSHEAVRKLYEKYL